MRTLRMESRVKAALAQTREHNKAWEESRVKVSENLVNPVNAALQRTMIHKNHLVVTMAGHLAQLKNDLAEYDVLPTTSAELTAHDRLEGAIQALKFVITTIERAT